jgi:hypothetical protein
VDARLLAVPPVLAVLRLEGAVPSAAVRAALERHAPRRFSAAVAPGPDGPELRPEPGRLGFGVVDAEAGELDADAGVNVPVRDRARLGLGDAPATDPVFALTHVRAPDGDALTVRLSHAAGDGLSLLRLLGAMLADLPAPGSAPRDAVAATGPGMASRTGDGERWLSSLPLSASCRAEIAALGDAMPGLSPTVRRMAVVARRLAPLALPEDADLRIRIPVDLRFRGLGIPEDAVGNHWFDALAVVPGPPRALPSVAAVAAAVDAAIRSAVGRVRPEDVDHRPDESLRLRRELANEPIRRGRDLVLSSLPAPRWPGVRSLRVLGSSSLGLVDVRGADRVDVVTPRPLAAGVTEL